MSGVHQGAAGREEGQAEDGGTGQGGQSQGCCRAQERWRTPRRCEVEGMGAVDGGPCVWTSLLTTLPGARMSVLYRLLCVMIPLHPGFVAFMR